MAMISLVCNNAKFKIHTYTYIYNLSKEAIHHLINFRSIDRLQKPKLVKKKMSVSKVRRKI